MSKATTVNGECFHFFVATDAGLECSECHYLLPLVSTWPVPLAIPAEQGIVNWYGSPCGWNGSGKYIRKTDE